MDKDTIGLIKVGLVFVVLAVFIVWGCHAHFTSDFDLLSEWAHRYLSSTATAAPSGWSIGDWMHYRANYPRKARVYVLEAWKQAKRRHDGDLIRSFLKEDARYKPPSEWPSDNVQTIVGTIPKDATHEQITKHVRAAVKHMDLSDREVHNLVTEAKMRLILKQTSNKK